MDILVSFAKNYTLPGHVEISTYFETIKFRNTLLRKSDFSK